MSNEAGRNFTDAEIAEWRATGMINGTHYSVEPQQAAAGGTWLGSPCAPVPGRHPYTHDQKVELYLKTIAWFTGVVAVAVIANLVAAIVIGVTAGAHHGFYDNF